MLFEGLFSKQLAELFERILSKSQCGFIWQHSQHCLQMMFETLKKATNNKNKGFGALLKNLSKTFVCLMMIY